MSRIRQVANNRHFNPSHLRHAYDIKMSKTWITISFHMPNEETIRKLKFEAFIDCREIIDEYCRFRSDFNEIADNANLADAIDMLLADQANRSEKALKSGCYSILAERAPYI